MAITTTVAAGTTQNPNRRRHSDAGRSNEIKNILAFLQRNLINKIVEKNITNIVIR